MHDGPVLDSQAASTQDASLPTSGWPSPGGTNLTTDTTPLHSGQQRTSQLQRKPSTTANTYTTDMSCNQKDAGVVRARVVQNNEVEYFSDTGRNDPKRQMRSSRKRADIQTAIRQTTKPYIKPQGTIWACCYSVECDFDLLQTKYNQGHFASSGLTILTVYTEVIFCVAFGNKTLFIFKFGCIVAWDFTVNERVKILNLLKNVQKTPPLLRHEDDEMTYVRSNVHGIRQDTIHLVSDKRFEKLASSYAFAQCVKLAFFETNVDETIERTRSIPESLAKTGKVNATREDISRRIGELFSSRFYINLHTDILDTPDIFWEFDEYEDHYTSCRKYLEIPKRVDILNQRLDIIKDLYDMLNDELSIQV